VLVFVLFLLYTILNTFINKINNYRFFFIYTSNRIKRYWMFIIFLCIQIVFFTFNTNLSDEINLKKFKVNFANFSTFPINVYTFT